MADRKSETAQIGSVVFGPRWDKPTAVGAGDGGTYIAEPVYRHEMLKLIEKISELEARLARLEVAPARDLTGLPGAFHK